ncbi:MAG: Rv3235 family protein [Micrococcales bacterium]|nr:Rv3235 family protein [Micrococcales bacterium]
MSEVVTHQGIPARQAGRPVTPEVCLRFVAACIVAAFNGRPPLPALQRYANQAVIHRLEQQASVARRRPGNRPTGQQTLRFSQVNEVVIEAVLIYKGQDRIRTAAIRMERDRGAWRVCFILLI